MNKFSDETELSYRGPAPRCAAKVFDTNDDEMWDSRDCSAKYKAACFTKAYGKCMVRIGEIVGKLVTSLWSPQNNALF